MNRDVDPTGQQMRGVNDYWQELDGGDIERNEHRDFVGGLWQELGQLQFDYLVGQGLKPGHFLLDVGCGALRGGLHFVRYLEPGHYCGIDANASLIQAGEVELARAGLDDQGARLVAGAGFDVSAFAQDFNYALAVSLFTHLSMNHIQVALSRVAAALKPGGAFYATFFEAPNHAYIDPIAHATGDVITWFERDPYHQSFAELSVLASRAGLLPERIGDFGHPRGQHMAVFRAPEPNQRRL